jgi:hypothetical protein
VKREEQALIELFELKRVDVVEMRTEVAAETGT